MDNYKQKPGIIHEMIESEQRQYQKAYSNHYRVRVHARMIAHREMQRMLAVEARKILEEHSEDVAAHSASRKAFSRFGLLVDQPDVIEEAEYVLHTTTNPWFPIAEAIELIEERFQPYGIVARVELTVADDETKQLEVNLHFQPRNGDDWKFDDIETVIEEFDVLETRAESIADDVSDEVSNA
jgi:hypothetical protein